MEPPATRSRTLATETRISTSLRKGSSSPTSMRDTLPARSDTGSTLAEASETSQKARKTSLLTAFIESKYHRILHLDETIGDLCWTPLRASRIDKRDQKNLMPYLALDPRSHRTAGPRWPTSVRGADRKVGYFWSALAVDDVFLLASSLACEGFVGLVYLWRWVKRMIVYPSWQKEVAVVAPPECHFEEYIWYSLGVSVNEENAVLTINDRSWTVSTAALLASDLDPISRLEADIAQCANRSVPLGVTETSHTIGQSSVVTTISEFPGTIKKGTSYTTGTPTRARPAQTSEVSPYTKSRTLQWAHSQISAAPAPPSLSSPPIKPSVRPAPPGSGTQKTAAPPHIISLKTVTMPSATTSDPRYMDPQRSPARSFSGNAHIRKSTEQTAPTDTCLRKCPKRKATEMTEGLVLPLRVRALRTESIPVKATTWPKYRLLANFTGTLSSRRGIYLALLDLPKRKRYPVRDPRQQREVDQDLQRTKQPSDESATRPLLPPSTVPPTSEPAKRAISPLPRQRVLANPSEHCGPSSSVRDPHEPRRTSGALQAGTVKTHEPISLQACNRCHARRIKCTRTALNLMCDTCIKLHLACGSDPICMRCKARRIKCTRTIPNLMCAPCDHLGVECDFGPTAPNKRWAKKKLLPSLADTLARIPSIPIPAGSMGEIRADPQPIAAPSSGGLCSYEEHVRDRLLIRTLRAKDDPRWTRNSDRQISRPSSDVCQASDDL